MMGLEPSLRSEFFQDLFIGPLAQGQSNAGRCSGAGGNGATEQRVVIGIMGFAIVGGINRETVIGL